MPTADDWDYVIASCNLTLRELEGLVEHIGLLGDKRIVNPFWARQVRRILLVEIEQLRFWVWPVEGGHTPRTETMWRRLNEALTSAEFAVFQVREVLF